MYATILLDVAECRFGEIEGRESKAFAGCKLGMSTVPRAACALMAEIKRQEGNVIKEPKREKRPTKGKLMKKKNGQGLEKVEGEEVVVVEVEVAVVDVVAEEEKKRRMEECLGKRWYRLAAVEKVLAC